jgi:MftR C-terminal domain
MVERVVTDALAERLGADPEHDPYPVLLAGAAVGVMRATMTFWASSGGAMALDQLTDAAYQALADGLPEHGGLRRLIEEAASPGSQQQRKDDR